MGTYKSPVKIYFSFLEIIICSGVTTGNSTQSLAKLVVTQYILLFIPYPLGSIFGEGSYAPSPSAFSPPSTY